MEQEQTQATEPLEDTPEPGSLDAAALAFEKRETSDEEEQASTEDTTDEAEPDAEPEDGEPEEEASEDEAAEIDFNGHALKVPKELAPELEKALLRQADYSRKMNEVAAKEKTYTERIQQAETLTKSAEAYAQVLAEAQVIDMRMKAMESVNWADLRANNPTEYAAAAADLQTLRLAKHENERRAQGLRSEVAQKQADQLIAEREEMFKELGKTYRGQWNDKLGEQITQYATANGVRFDSLLKMTDPGLVIALDKARKYDELQKSKTAVKEKVKAAPPVVKPGTPKRAAPADDAMAKLRKSKTLDDAAAAFLARMK